MVLFDNIVVNQRVEVRYAGRIYRGTVRYKGCLNGKPGDWVGVELDAKDGRTDGMLSGRRYFQCRPGHGIFTTADNIRFIRMSRCLFDTYRSVDDKTFLDDELFSSDYSSRENDMMDEAAQIPDSWQRRAYRGFPDHYEYERPRSHHLRHSVSSSVPAVTMLRPTTSKAPFSYGSRRLYHTHEPDSDDDYDDFTASPSIPKPHMPYMVEKEHDRRGWQDVQHPRYMRLHTGRNSYKFNQWNAL